MIIKLSMYIVDMLLSSKIFKIQDIDDFTDKVIFCVFFIISNIFFFGLGILLHCALQVMIVLIVLTVLRLFSGGYHSSVDRCLMISVPYILLISIIAKYAINYSDFLCFLSILAGVYIIKKVPIIPKIDMNNKIEKWFQGRYIDVFLLFYVINYICLSLHSGIGNLISSSISMAILGVALMMRKNKKINYD